MVVSESIDSSFWHKCTIGADRGAEIFDILPRRGVGPVVPVPESAVDQFSGLSGARPQSGFAGKASVLRMPLSSCPGLWPPSAASSGLMHSHQHLLSGGACLYLVARPAHHDRHFLKTEPQRGANSMAGQSDIVSDKIPTKYRRSPRHNTGIVPTQYRHSATTLSKITRRGRNPQNSKEQAVPRPSEAPQTPEIPVTTP